MGHLKDKYGIIMLDKNPPGTCPECAFKHASEQPHNRDSLCYQYKFYDRHGRWPTWADAMAHCSPEIKAAWRQGLQERGVDCGEESPNVTKHGD